MGRPKGSKNKPKEVEVQTIAISDNSQEIVAEQEKEDARAKGLDDPDFDFRQIYTPGQKVYYVYVNDFDGTKEVQDLIVRTVYARSIIAFMEHGMCYCLGYPQRDLIYLRKDHAEEACKQIKVVAKYGGNNETNDVG